MSGGELKLEFDPINSIVDRADTPEEVMAGVLIGDLTAMSNFTGRDPAYAILGDLIVGYVSVDQVQTFCRHGGGRDALQELWDATLPGAVHVVGCAAAAKEALVAKVPINGVADLEGKKKSARPLVLRQPCSRRPARRHRSMRIWASRNV